MIRRFISMHTFTVLACSLLLSECGTCYYDGRGDFAKDNRDRSSGSHMTSEMYHNAESVVSDVASVHTVQHASQDYKKRKREKEVNSQALKRRDGKSKKHESEFQGALVLNHKLNKRLQANMQLLQFQIRKQAGIPADVTFPTSSTPSTSFEDFDNDDDSLLSVSEGERWFANNQQAFIKQKINVEPQRSPIQLWWDSLKFWQK